MHTAETGHIFDLENAKAIDHDHLKGERVMKEALHSGTQAACINCGLSLSIIDSCWHCHDGRYAFRIEALAIPVVGNTNLWFASLVRNDGVGPLLLVPIYCHIGDALSNKVFDFKDCLQDCPLLG